MTKYDLQNLLCMWDESLLKVIDHLRQGFPDRALLRCTEMHKALTKLKDHCTDCDRKVVDEI